MAALAHESTGSVHLPGGASREAVKKYGVPGNEVVLGDISVETENELVGTVRGWRATAQAGRQRTHTAQAPPSTEDRLRELDRLLERHVISHDEYERKRAAILNEL